MTTPSDSCAKPEPPQRTSIELRLVATHDPAGCTCRKPYILGKRPVPGCFDVLVCDFGTIDYPRPDLTITYGDEKYRVTVEGVRPLVLVSREFADTKLCSDPVETEVSTFYTLDDRRFMRIDADNGSWTWELFDAHWDDGEPCGIYVGRWPD